MSIAAQRAALVGILAAVPDIGVVHAHERNASDMARLKALYVSPGLGLRGWYLRRVKTAETDNVQGRTVEQLQWLIRGFMAFDDGAESELAFDALIEAIRDAVAADETLAGTVDAITATEPDGASGVQLTDAGPVMFGGVLCHSCRLSLTTYRYLTRPY